MQGSTNFKLQVCGGTSFLKIAIHIVRCFLERKKEVRGFCFKK